MMKKQQLMFLTGSRWGLMGIALAFLVLPHALVQQTTAATKANNMLEMHSDLISQVQTSTETIPDLVTVLNSTNHREYPKHYFVENLSYEDFGQINLDSIIHIDGASIFDSTHANFLSDCIEMHGPEYCMSDSGPRAFFLIALIVILVLLIFFMDELEELLDRAARDANYRDYEEACNHPQHGETNTERSKTALEEVADRKEDCASLEGNFDVNSSGDWTCTIPSSDGGPLVLEGSVEVNYIPVMF